MENNNNLNRLWTPQFIIGISLTVIVLGWLIILTWLSVKEIDSFDDIKYILGVILPLIGTWVGTVLAFYFSSENFDSANKNVRSLVNQVTTTAEKLRSILAKEVMIKKEEIKGFTFEKNKDDDDYTLEHLMGKIKEHGMNRLPIFNNDGSIRYIIHRSILDRYIADNFNKESEKLLNTSISELFKNNPTIKEYFNTFVIVGEEDSLSIAKRKMESKSGCLDIFVTKSGSPEKPVTGWISNLIIAENSKI